MSIPVYLAVSSTKLSVWAIYLSICSVVIALTSICANVYTWYRSGGNIKTRLRVIEHPRDRLKDKIEVEVIGAGRQPAIVNQIEIGHRYDTGKTTSNNTPIYADSWDSKLKPLGNALLPVSLEPTGNIRAQITVDKLVKVLGYNTPVQLIARAIRGDGKIAKSKVLNTKMPGK